MSSSAEPHLRRAARKCGEVEGPLLRRSRLPWAVLNQCRRRRVFDIVNASAIAYLMESCTKETLRMPFIPSGACPGLLNGFSVAPCHAAPTAES